MAAGGVTCYKPYPYWEGADDGDADVDMLVRSDPETIYRRSRALLERTQDKGKYALGTGNSVAEYIPLENYFAMLSAAHDH